MKGTTAITKLENSAVIANEYFGDSVVDAFIASRHISANSQKSYRNALNQLQKFFAANSITTPTAEAIDAFIENLRTAGKATATMRLYTTTVKLFFAFAERRGICTNCAVDVKLNLKKVKTHRRKSLTNEQAKALLAAVQGNSLIAKRDRAIVALSLQTGIRTCEASRANVGNLYEENGSWFLAVTGKGHTEADAVVRVAPAVVKMILSYLEARGKVTDDAPLFASHSNNVNWQKNSFGRRLSAQSIGKMLKRMMKSVGIDDKKITAHSTRHFAATCAIEAGIDLRDVQSMLRHTSIEITTCYLHDISEKNRRAELAVADSLFGVAA